ncbi:MAG: hypothetical protein ACK42D_01690 [Candidatus Paceibacteria bacterium]
MSDDINENEIDGGEELNDDEATLADDLLDEVSADDTSDDLLEGFGVLPDATTDEEEEETEEKDELEDDTESLEDDAEDVDFDLFDDVDEL